MAAAEDKPTIVRFAVTSKSKLVVLLSRKWLLENGASRMQGVAIADLRTPSWGNGLSEFWQLANSDCAIMLGKGLVMIEELELVSLDAAKHLVGSGNPAIKRAIQSSLSLNPKQSENKQANDVRRILEATGKN